MPATFAASARVQVLGDGPVASVDARLIRCQDKSLYLHSPCSFPPGVSVRVDVNGTNAQKGDFWDMDGARIREVEQGPDGAIYVLEDERGTSQGRLLRLTPTR